MHAPAASWLARGVLALQLSVDRLARPRRDLRDNAGIPAQPGSRFRTGPAATFTDLSPTLVSGEHSSLRGASPEWSGLAGSAARPGGVNQSTVRPEAVGQAHRRLPAEVAAGGGDVGGAVADVAGPRVGVLRVDLDAEDRPELVEQLQQRVRWCVPAML